jgi:hypothetical protein
MDLDTLYHFIMLCLSFGGTKEVILKIIKTNWEHFHNSRLSVELMYFSESLGLFMTISNKPDQCFLVYAVCGTVLWYFNVSVLNLFLNVLYLMVHKGHPMYSIKFAVLLWKQFNILIWLFSKYWAEVKLKMYTNNKLITWDHH